MRHIGFSHRYKKLHGQTSGQLINVTIVDIDDITPEAMEYDTEYDGGRYEFSSDDRVLIRLVFLGDKGIPFTTYRSDTEEHRQRFYGGVNEIFTFNIKTEA